MASLTMTLSCGTQQREDPDEGTEGKCIKGNCYSGLGTYVYPNGNRYEGEFRSGKPFGYGTMYYPGGKSLKGKWKWGRPDLR
ncbi:MAG: hypothetical protein JW807_07565 [Spirochaetes bacterium]|nr:hypothetical protein [Spirochaetota bacterium]